MYQNQWVRRPLETVIQIAIALVVLGLAFSIVRWAVSGNWQPFDGQLLSGALSAIGIALAVMFGLAVAGIVIWAIVATTMAPHKGGWGGPQDWATWGAAAELKKRYAKGLISRDEYLRTLKDLEADAKAPAPPEAPAEPKLP